jgi:hypothetical protein
LLKKEEDENMFISLTKIRMTNVWHGKERQKHHLTIPIHGKFSLVLQWISHTLYIFGNIYTYIYILWIENLENHVAKKDSEMAWGMHTSWWTWESLTIPPLPTWEGTMNYLFWRW